MLHVNQHDYSITIDNVTMTTFPGSSHLTKHILARSADELPAHDIEYFTTDEALIARMLEIAPEAKWQVVEPED
jgi:hypothetical protein